MKASFMIHPLSIWKQNWVLNSICDLINSFKTVITSNCTKISHGYTCASKLLHEKYQIENKREAVGSAQVWIMLQALWMIVVGVLKTIKLHYFSTKSTSSNMNHHTSSLPVELIYSHRNKQYKILVTNPNTFSHIQRCVSAKATIKQAEKIVEEDVTEQIVKLLGPYENWHHQTYTPATFGWESLTIFKLCDETFDTIEHTFEATDKLIKVSEMKTK